MEEKDRLKEIREALALSQKEMADRFNKTQTAWSSYERGFHKIPADVYLKLKEEGFNIDWLKSGAGEMKIDVQNSKGKNQIPFFELNNMELNTDLNDSPQKILDISFLEKYNAFRMHGQSMEPKIYSGDIVFVEFLKSANTILNGESYLIFSNEIKTIRNVFFDKENKTLILKASNPAYEGDTSISVESIAKIGLVRAVFRNF